MSRWGERRHGRVRWAWGPFGPLVLCAVTSAPATAQEADPYQWLEDSRAEPALDWVAERNRETLAAFSDDPLFGTLERELLETLQSNDRLRLPTVRGDLVYSFRTDADHPRGLYERTPMAAYLAGAPRWETVLDIDVLAEAEDVPWTFGGMTCQAPREHRCMVRLWGQPPERSELREFDLPSATFVEGGFRIPGRETRVAWVSGDTLLVSTDAGEGSLTRSGYGRSVRLWARGTPLSAALTVFEAGPDDHAALPYALPSTTGTRVAIAHYTTFHELTTYLLRGSELTRLDLPTQASPSLLGDQLVVHLRAPWEHADTTFPTGSIIATDLEAFLDGAPDFEIVAAPGPRSTIRTFRHAGDALLVTRMENVIDQLWTYRRADGRWVGTPVPTPEPGTIRVVAARPWDPRFFFTYSSFTEPTTLFVHDSVSGASIVASAAPRFQARGQTVEQYHATSADGTRIPYFLVGPEGLALDGSHATLLTGYGAFADSETSSYDPIVGKAWLERGGVYVVANIRGGGEFGPAWHRAAIRENRMRSYEDFIAVAEDLIARGVTRPGRLGLRGSSNGGLLVAVAMTQRPDLFGAVVAHVPLLDMRRYHELSIGASWIAEYGDPDLPEDWAHIRRYSPYHNVEAGEDYPPSLLTTMTHDGVVPPAHARKMAAKMLDQGHGVRFFEGTDGGHDAGATAASRAHTLALHFAFLWRELVRSPDRR